MKIHTIEPGLETTRGYFSADLPPITTVRSGDRVRLRTLDAGWHSFDQRDPHKQLEKLAWYDAARDPGHAVCGPIAVEGARAGMVLEIRFLAVEPAPWGWSVAGGWPSEVNRRLGVAEGEDWPMRWVLDTEAGVGTNQFGQSVRLRPFMGITGMPPAGPGQHSTVPPRFCGGNIDCKELVAGSILYLPVPMDGGMLYVGDGHALQGDGEAAGPALECPMELVEIEVHLAPEMELAFPHARSPQAWLTFGFHEDLDEAAMLALDGMLDLMGRTWGLGRKEALAWASLVVDLRLSQLVNGVRGVHAVLPDEAVAPFRHKRAG